MQEEVAKGCDLAVAQAKVARRERKQLEERMKARAAPMEEADPPAKMGSRAVSTRVRSGPATSAARE